MKKAPLIALLAAALLVAGGASARPDALSSGTSTRTSTTAATTTTTATTTAPEPKSGFTTVTATVTETGAPVAGILIADWKRVSTHALGGTDSNGVAVFELPNSPKPYVLSADGADAGGHQIHGQVSLLASGGDVAITIRVTRLPEIVPTISLARPQPSTVVSNTPVPCGPATEHQACRSTYRLRAGVPALFWYRVSDPTSNYIYSLEITAGATGTKDIAGTGAVIVMAHVSGGWLFRQGKVIRDYWRWVSPKQPGTYRACLAALDANQGGAVRGSAINCQLIEVVGAPPPTPKPLQCVSANAVGGMAAEAACLINSARHQLRLPPLHAAPVLMDKANAMLADVRSCGGGCQDTIEEMGIRDYPHRVGGAWTWVYVRGGDVPRRVLAAWRSAEGPFYLDGHARAYGVAFDELQGVKGPFVEMYLVIGL